MNKRVTFCTISLISIAFILCLFLSTASADTAESVLPTITETRITTSGSANDPDIYNDITAWVDYRNGNNDVYMYNISTKEEIKVPTNGSADCPCIYGDKIVWEDDSHMLPSWDLSDIHMYDISTKKETQIPSRLEELVAKGQPDIYGDKIVWQDLYDEDWGVSMYDLSTKEETLIAHDALRPAIYGNRIVYFVSHPRKGPGSDIYMYDLSTKKETRITASRSADYPAIYGNRIVYADDRKGNYDIYMYDLSTKKETQITSSPDNQVSPAIYGNRILWKDVGGEDDGREYHGIYMCDLSTNQKFKITSRGSESDPAIYGNRVVYTDNHNGKSDIYMSTISSKEPEPNLPVADFSASPTSGKAPLNVKFTDTSTGTPTKWKWDFGDGTTSTKQNPTHKYSKAGVYTVKLTVTNAAGSNTATKSNYITVTGTSQAPVADFWGWPLSGKAPLKVTFTETSKGSPTSWKWDFGDGKSSTEKSPIHTYSAAGTYTVKLTSTNAAGSSTKTKWNYIKVAK